MVHTRYAVPDGNEFVDFTGGFVKAQLKSVRASSTPVLRDAKEKRQINIGMRSSAGGADFFGIEEINSLLNDGYEFLCVEEGGLIMDIRYEGPDGSHRGNFEGVWLTATMSKKE